MKEAGFLFLDDSGGKRTVIFISYHAIRKFGQRSGTSTDSGPDFLL
jgi:hypothetical protein